MKILQQIFEHRLLLNESMSKHSTLRLGGPAKYFLEAKNSDEVAKAVNAAKAEYSPCVVIGGGSNILCSDNGFGGLVIKMAANEIRISKQTIYVDAGVFSTSLARTAAEAGLTGLEWMATLPGTVGGAIYGNAGAYGEETKDRLSRVKALDISLGEKWISKEDCGFGYRDSRFKSTKEIILGAEFKLEAGDKEEIKKKMNELLEKRKKEQPLGASSAGCIFKNFKFSVYGGPAGGWQVPEEFLKNKTIPAGWLIDKAGMKGFCVGRVCVSERHGNFSLTQSGATAGELIQLIYVIKNKVREKFGIELQEEVQYIGF